MMNLAFARGHEVGWDSLQFNYTSYQVVFCSIRQSSPQFWTCDPSFGFLAMFRSNSTTLERIAHGVQTSLPRGPVSCLPLDRSTRCVLPALRFTIGGVPAPCRLSRRATPRDAGGRGVSRRGCGHRPDRRPPPAVAPPK